MYGLDYWTKIYGRKSGGSKFVEGKKENNYEIL
jgi:hypothetical protein